MRIRFVGKVCVSDDEFERNHAYGLSLGLPFVTSESKSGKRVAAVGGGPSLPRHLDTLRAWDGPIWATNGAWTWLRDRGIEATFFAMDPQPISAFGDGFCLQGVKSAIVGSALHRSVFDALAGADVRLFDSGDASRGGMYSSTAITAAPAVAVMAGHAGVRFFACDSSFLEQTHAYDNIPSELMLIVVCGGERFLTDPPLVLQAEFIAQVQAARPRFVQVEDDGFLGALVRHNGEYSVDAVTSALGEKMKPIHHPKAAPAVC